MALIPINPNALSQERVLVTGGTQGMGEAIATIQGLKPWYRVSGKGPICIVPTPVWGPSSEMSFQTLTRRISSSER